MLHLLGKGTQIGRAKDGRLGWFTWDRGTITVFFIGHSLGGRAELEFLPAKGPHQCRADGFVVAQLGGGRFVRRSFRRLRSSGFRAGARGLPPRPRETPPR